MDKMSIKNASLTKTYALIIIFYYFYFLNQNGSSAHPVYYSQWRKDEPPPPPQSYKPDHMRQSFGPYTVSHQDVLVVEEPHPPKPHEESYSVTNSGFGSEQFVLLAHLAYMPMSLCNHDLSVLCRCCHRWCRHCWHCHCHCWCHV